MKRFALSIIGVVLVAACSPEQAPASPTMPPPPPSVAPNLPPPTTERTQPETQPPTFSPSSLEPQKVEIEGAEGLVIKGTFLPAAEAKAPGVLLLHMLSGQRSDWAELALALQDRGIASLAIDQRGHGETGGSINWTLARQDVANALAWLRANEAVDAGRTAVIGASIGANLALVAGTGDPAAVAIVSLSPGINYFGVQTAGLLSEPVDQAVLLVASEDDAYSADTVRQLAEEADGQAALILLETAGHGTVMLARQPDLSDDLIEFLQGSFEG